MKTFMLWDKSLRKPLAFHNEKRVIEKFKLDYELSNPKEKLILIKLHMHELKKYPEYSDLYLVRYGEKYVQAKYLYIAELDYGQIIYDFQYAIDVLNHIAEFEKSEKRRKKLLTSVEIVRSELEKIQNEAVDTRHLEQRHREYELYRNRTRWNERL